MSIFRRVSLLGFALVSLVVLAACGGNGGGVISAENGGTATSDDGKLTLEIPPGALGEDTEITVTAIPVDELPEALREDADGGPAYRLEPDGLEFSQPVAVSLELGKADLPEDQPENGTFAYELLTQDEDGEPEFLDELETEASLDDGTVVVRGKLDHFTFITKKRGTVILVVDPGTISVPPGSFFEAEISIVNLGHEEDPDFGKLAEGQLAARIIDVVLDPFFTGSVVDVQQDKVEFVEIREGEREGFPFVYFCEEGVGGYGADLTYVTAPVGLPGFQREQAMLLLGTARCGTATPTPTTTPSPTPEADELTPSLTPNLSSDTEPKVAFSDASNDAFDCAGGEDAVVVDLAVDMLYGGVMQLPDGVVVRVTLSVRPIESAKDASFAVQAQIGQEGRSQVAQYEFSGGQPNNGRLDDAGNVIPGSEGDVTTTGGELTFFFPDTVLKKGDTMTVRSSHQRNPEDAVNCDVTDAFPLDELVP